ncbi:MAG TPA: class I adenylate-forming enzyme family protein [Gaiellaceae bacterium]|nr:class I adenylate-forming enzyme family protein [Gaiellaceae bacterium]
MPARPQMLVQDSLLDSAVAFPRHALADEFGRRTYEELADDAMRVARLLQDEGLERGDRVALYLDNTAQCAAAIFGTLLAGGVFVIVNPQTKAEKLAFILDDSGATFLISEGHSMHVAAEAVRLLRRDVRVFGTRAAAVEYSFPQLEQALLATEARPAGSRSAPSDLAALVYTSGTTGRRKGVMLSHDALVFVVGSIAQYLRLDAGDRILNILPLAYTYGLSQLLLAVRLGATLLLERTFAFPSRTLERMHAEQATVFGAVPTVYATLIGMQHVRSYDSIRCLTNAAAALPPAFHDRIQRIFPNAKLFRMYGQTECVRISYLEPELITSRPTSVGSAIPGTEVFVLNDDGKQVAPGETGELHVRGPHLMMGYWGDPHLTEEKLTSAAFPGERILRTHDHFTVDEDGLLYFVGRSDDIIKTRGEKVSTAEIENLLHGLAGVRQAAVVGVPDELLGEAIRAYVVLEKGAELTKEDLLRYAASRLENYMVPREVVILDELPHTESGKVRKRSLLETAEDPAEVARQA